MKAPTICSVKWVACQSVEIAFRCGPFACLQRGTEGRLPPSTEKAIPSVPSLSDHHPTPPPQVTGVTGQTVAIVTSRVSAQQADSSERHPVLGRGRQGREGQRDGEEGKEKERDRDAHSGGGGGGGRPSGASARNSAHGKGHEEGGLAHAKA